MAHSLLQDVPQRFGWIQVWRIRREFVDFDSRMSAQKSPQNSISMNGASVPKQNHISRYFSQKHGQKRLNMGGGQRVLIYNAPRIPSFPSRRYANCRNHGKMLPFETVVQKGSFSSWRPRSPYRGRKCESTFIQENQVRQRPRCLFLYAPNRLLSIDRFLFRVSPRRFAPASDGSISIFRPRFFLPSSDPSGPRIFPRSHIQCVGESTALQDTQRQLHPDAKSPPVPARFPGVVWKVFPLKPLVVKHPSLQSDRPFSIFPPSLQRLRGQKQLLGSIDRLSITGWLAFAAILDTQNFHGVSCRGK